MEVARATARGVAARNRPSEICALARPVSVAFSLWCPTLRIGAARAMSNAKPSGTLMGSAKKKASVVPGTIINSAFRISDSSSVCGSGFRSPGARIAAGAFSVPAAAQVRMVATATCEAESLRTVNDSATQVNAPAASPAATESTLE